jgi:hypothetical protein
MYQDILNMNFGNKKRVATPCIIHCWLLPTYENPRGFSIRVLFAKLSA